MKISLTYKRQVRHYLKPRIITVKVLQLRLSVKERKGDFNHVKHLLNIMEECDLNAQKSLQVLRTVDRDSGC